MALNAEEVRWVAQLARLQLSDAELAEMTAQLTAILDYVTQLQEVNTTDVEPLAHSLPVSNVFRDDEAGASLPTREALGNAPHREGDFFSVPAVLD